ncbi:MAG: DUF6714 family protein [Pirellulales bacterium]
MRGYAEQLGRQVHDGAQYAGSGCIMDELGKRIIAAFSAVKYPGDDKLTVYSRAGRAHDEVWAILKGKEWTQCPVTVLMRCDTPLADLTPAAFCYYMPAFLLACLDNGESGDIAHSLVYYLSAASYSDRAIFCLRLSEFNQQQRDVMREVLYELIRRGVESEDDAHGALAALDAGCAEKL